MNPRVIILIPVVVFASACGCSFPQKIDTWTVMTWNVQNLFDGTDDGTEYPEFDPGNGDWNERLYKRRLDRTGDIIGNDSIGAIDLVVLQELESPRILDDLAEGPLKKYDYHWRLAVPGFSIIRCGVLSRYPLRDVEVVDCGSFGIRPLRPVLTFTVETPGGPVRIAALHWKSPRDGRAATEETRRREATAVRDHFQPLLSGFPAAQALIIGDLNTPGDGYVTPAALAPWEPGIEAGTDDAVLYRTDAVEGVGFQNGIYVFFDPDPESSSGSEGTYWYKQKWDRPDRALLSRGMTAEPGLVFEHCRTGLAEFPEEAGISRPVPWRMDLEEGYSDHLPLVLSFTVPAAE